MKGNPPTCPHPAPICLHSQKSPFPLNKKKKKRHRETRERAVKKSGRERGERSKKSERGRGSRRRGECVRVWISIIGTSFRALALPQSRGLVSGRSKENGLIISFEVREGLR